MNLTVNFGSKVNIARCIKNHKPLSIIPMFTDNNTRYFIFDRQNRLFGALILMKAVLCQELNLNQTEEKLLPMHYLR